MMCSTHCPAWKWWPQQTANWSQDEAFDVMESLLQQHPDVKGVICGNDTMALGAQAALDAAGLGDTVIVAGFDGSDDVNASIMAGKIDVGALQPVAEMAIQAVIQADLYLRTGSTGMPEKQSIDMVLLTPENACQYTQYAPNGNTSCTPVTATEPEPASRWSDVHDRAGLENPFFGSEQEIAAAKVEELGYTTLKLVHDTMPTWNGN